MSSVSLAGSETAGAHRTAPARVGAGARGFSGVADAACLPKAAAPMHRGAQQRHHQARRGRPGCAAGEVDVEQRIRRVQRSTGVQEELHGSVLVVRRKGDTDASRLTSARCGRRAARARLDGGAEGKACYRQGEVAWDSSSNTVAQGRTQASAAKRPVHGDAGGKTRLVSGRLRRDRRIGNPAAFQRTDSGVALPLRAHGGRAMQGRRGHDNRRTVPRTARDVVGVKGTSRATADCVQVQLVHGSPRSRQRRRGR